MCVCEADKGRKAAQALIRCHAVGQRIPPLLRQQQLQTNSGQSPTKPNFVHPSPEKEAPENCPPANVCVMEKKKKKRERIYLVTP